MFPLFQPKRIMMVSAVCDSSCLLCLWQFVAPVLICIDPDALPAAVS